MLAGDGPVLVLAGGLLTGWGCLPKAQCDVGVVKRYEVIGFVRRLGRCGQAQRARRIQPDGREQIKGAGRSRMMQSRRIGPGRGGFGNQRFEEDGGALVVETLLLQWHVQRQWGRIV